MVRFTTGQLDPFLRSSIGFDHLFRELDRDATRTQQSYPPYNIIKETDEKYRIEVAVSGFSENELNVEVKESTLTVSGVKEKETEVEYLHKGIGGRNFERTFTLAADLVVKSADIQNGILVIGMELIIPEHKKPRTIKINGEESTSEPELLVE